MKKVLVTGGLGNIGTKIVDELLLKGYQVSCLDLKNKNNLKVARKYRNKIEILWGDITDAPFVARAILGIDAVIHTAAILPPFSEVNPKIAHRVNVGGTQNILQALETHNPHAQMIFASSVSVHGNHLPDRAPGLSIDSPFEPIDHYASHKIECEKQLTDTDLNWTVLRISACVDEKSRMLDVRNIKDSLQTFLRVNPDCRIEYIHPADVATAMVNAIGNKEAIGKRFFLGGGKRCQSTWRDLNSLRVEMLGLDKPPAECFGTDGFYTEWLDTEESQRILNFQNHDLEDYKKELDTLLKWPRLMLKPAAAALNKGIWRLLPAITEKPNRMTDSTA